MFSRKELNQLFEQEVKNLNTTIRKSSIIIICLLLICAIVIGFTLITIATTDKGKAWAQGFVDNRALSQNLIMQTSSPQSSSTAYLTGAYKENHFHRSREPLGNNDRWPHERLRNAIKEDMSEKIDKIQERLEEHKNSTPSQRIKEHIMYSGELLSRHIQRSQDRLNKFLEWYK